MNDDELGRVMFGHVVVDRGPSASVEGSLVPDMSMVRFGARDDLILMLGLWTMRNCGTRLHACDAGRATRTAAW